MRDRDKKKEIEKQTQEERVSELLVFNAQPTGTVISRRWKRERERRERERERRERERQTDRQTDRQRQRQTQTQTHRQTETETERQRESGKQTEKERTHRTPTPDIRTSRETVESQPLWRRPLDGELGPCMGRVSIILH